MRVLTAKGLALALAASFGMASVAHAEVQDRVIAANVEPSVLYQQIVVAAASMCREADAAGEIVNVNKCIKIVTAKTVAEINRPSLTSYALANETLREG
jgi:hypothetical protein